MLKTVSIPLPPRSWFKKQLFSILKLRERIKSAVTLIRHHSGAIVEGVIAKTTCPLQIIIDLAAKARCVLQWLLTICDHHGYLVRRFNLILQTELWIECSSVFRVSIIRLKAIIAVGLHQVSLLRLVLFLIKPFQLPLLSKVVHSHRQIDH